MPFTRSLPKGLNMTVTRTAQKRRAQTNREAWLTEVIRLIRPTFKAAGLELPPVRVSVGWPGGKRSKNVILGQCWSPTAATDNRTQIFISPLLADGRRAIDVLVHELVHAVDKNEHGHTKPFELMARAVGLEGKPTETHAGPDLAQKAQQFVAKLGKYPHAALADTATDGTKKQTTRMRKLVCQCGQPRIPTEGDEQDEDGRVLPTVPRILRLSQKAIDAGPIICGICEAEFVEPPTDDEDQDQDEG